MESASADTARDASYYMFDATLSALTAVALALLESGPPIRKAKHSSRMAKGYLMICLLLASIF